ncbi:MAG: acetylglutamate kinase [Xanthomonadales bacterium]|nr:acetylglutamate kinase [Xanthomonadales bacterium]
MPFAANPYDALKGLSKYLREFRGKTFVVKLGGEVLDDPDARRKVVEQLGVLWTLSIRLVIVHGGGKRLDQLCQQLDLPIEKRNGRRVTTPAVLDAARMVLAGSVQNELIAELNRVAVPAVGLTGVDAGTVRARKRAPLYLGAEGGKDELFDFGLVGDIEGIDPKLLLDLTSKDYVPVLAPLTGNREGQVFNTNADTVAAHLAAALGAEKLFFIMGVPGLLRDVNSQSSLVSFATLAKLEEMEARGELSAGMLPKSAAIKHALNHDVQSVHLVSGVQADALLVEIFTNEGAGTMLVREEG